MIDHNCFGVIGGDQRQIALAESIAADGYIVYANGFDDVTFHKDVKKASLELLCGQCGNIILPLPVSRDGKYLNVVYSKDKVLLDDAFAAMMQDKNVYGGMMNKLYATSELWDGIRMYDYYNQPEFAVRNAVPTAEGAIEIAMREYSGTVNGSRCLVVGFGRIGKSLAWMLRGIGANVTVSARNQSDLAWIEAYGYHAAHTDRILEREQYDIIFNTVPALIFDRKRLSKVHPDTLIIDLASAPGGIDREISEKLGIKTVQALSLPGKVAPKTAGEIIKTTIYNMMEE